jgi:predicted phosphoadenosine phosphosulfate sulfurtransferase
MRIYRNQNVYDAALDRIRFIFDEFPDVIADVSGGKDSTVIFNLALQVAREKNRLPLRVMFIDQEAEWQATRDVITETMYHPDVEPLWFQMPIRLFNATSATEHWLECWEPSKEGEWVHPKDPISIKDNVYGTDRFTKLFEAIPKHDYPNQRVAYLGGVRTEENPRRFLSTTWPAKYKWITWASGLNRPNHYVFYPLYDWSYTDIWKAISSNGWPYNRIYDVQYQSGISVWDMRVSNVHHETAILHLFYMQEAEPETYARLVARIRGIDMAGKMGAEHYFATELPFMFDSWKEYRDYLLEHLIDDEHWKGLFRARFAVHDRELGEELGDKKYKTHIQSILTNDWEGIKLRNWDTSPKVHAARKRMRGEEAYERPRVRRAVGSDR